MLICRIAMVVRAVVLPAKNFLSFKIHFGFILVKSNSKFKFSLPEKIEGYMC